MGNELDLARVRGDLEARYGGGSPNLEVAGLVSLALALIAELEAVRGERATIEAEATLLASERDEHLRRVEELEARLADLTKMTWRVFPQASSGHGWPEVADYLNEARRVLSSSRERTADERD